MNRSKICFFVIAALSLVIVACGDSHSSASPDSEYDVQNNTLKDLRDNQVYKTTTIGTQTWMAENLNYESENSYCYGDTPSNCTENGRLYTWEAAQKACPRGWHLPSKSEFETLISSVGGLTIAAVVLRTSDDGNWEQCPKGTDDYSFAAKSVGFRDLVGEFYDQVLYAGFWSSTEDYREDVVDGCSMSYYSYSSAVNLGCGGKDYGYSVRCVKDDDETLELSSSIVSSSSAFTTGEITDSRDNQTYKTVTIDSMIWMAENLNYETSGSYCHNCAKYGRFYTWNAAINACPSGWRLPSTSEFELLFSAVGGQSIAGVTLKSTTSDWLGYSNDTGINSFAALPAGYRQYYRDDDVDEYVHEGGVANFWSSIERDSIDAYYMSMTAFDWSASLHYEDKNNGISVRCVKN